MSTVPEAGSKNYFDLQLADQTEATLDLGREKSGFHGVETHWQR
jgi:hypothetical protein